MVKVWPQKRVDEELVQKINNVFILGAQRTREQDVEFAINQLVEIALRALSPGINDPFTAIACIDRLGAALCHLVEREFPPSYWYDDTETLRVVADVVTFAGVVDAAFHQIRQYGRSSAAVTIRLLETLAVVAAHTSKEEDRAVLLHHATMIERGSHTGLAEEQDRTDVEERYQAIVRVLTPH